MSTGRHAQQINSDFANFVNDEVLPLTCLDKDKFWDDFIHLIDDFSAINRELLTDRDKFQLQIDHWHQQQEAGSYDAKEYKQFLKDIGYILEEGDDFTIETANVDEEIAQISGPQLVVPLKNARYALNATNARWGSLYDVLYGTDVIPQLPGLGITRKYNSARGRRVMEYTKHFLDEIFPLQEGSHRDVSTYLIYFNNLLATFPDGHSTGLKDNRQFVASNGSKNHPESIVLKNNGLHVELQIDRNGRIGSQDLAGIDDIQIESALTTILDCEDSVAAVDIEDKITVYRNWLGLIEGNLKARFEKDGKTVVRHPKYDRRFTSRDGDPYTLHGRSLLIIRNVGLHMDTDLIKDAQGNNIPEGIIDAVITSIIASLDLQHNRTKPNSRRNSIYIIKPKLHGPEEVRMTCELFDRVEDMLELSSNTIKIGIMDEERRTSLNLKECIRVAKARVAFVNTGFLDRTADEIHTSTHAGVFLGKSSLQEQPWFLAYENNNVDVALACGFQGKAQIGKGMWPMPDEMNRMMAENISHPQAGANTAWVPSPTAATLHALHYHKVDVFAVQNTLENRHQANVEGLLTIPLMDYDQRPTDDEIRAELEANAQSILAYVVHWVDHGNGCLKIPDINNIGLMEDRATLRISAQHIANWMQHGLCDKAQVESVLQQMAAFVDQQNSHRSDYEPLTPNTDESLAFKAAHILIFDGIGYANRYTENILHNYRKQVKNLRPETEKPIHSQTKEAS